MTDKKTEALKLALEALETERNNYQDWDEKDGAPEYIYDAITVVREALSEQPAQKQGLQDLWHKAWPEAGAFVRASADDLTRFAQAVSSAPQPAQPSKPLTDEQFLELILRNGTVELVGSCTFVGGSIQMQGKMGLLRSAKIIKEFVEAAHGIKGDA